MKIHDANEDIIKQDAKRKEKRSKHQSIENNYHPLETLGDVIQNKYNSTPQTKFTVRLDDELENTLRVYADERGLSVPSSIKSICEKYFQDKWITRSFFHLDKPFTVAIPIVPYEIEKYIEDGINCIIHLSRDINTRLDVQSQLISKDETENYLAVTFNVGNNYLDIYDEELDCYFAGTLRNNHIGLFDVYLDHLKQSVFIRIIYDKKNPISARLITKHEAIQNAINTDNPMLEVYLKHIEQSNDIKEYKQSIKERETYIMTLEARIKSLENEISILKDELKEHDAENQDNNMQGDTDGEIKGHDPNYSMLSPATQNSLVNVISQMLKMKAEQERLSRDVTNALLNIPLYPNIMKGDDDADDENKSDDVDDEF